MNDTKRRQIFIETREIFDHSISIGNLYEIKNDSSIFYQL
jgi:hypothetical protein